MLLKLSLSSMRKMMKDYLVLLVGLVVSISIFYMFQTLAMNSDYVKANSMIRSIGIVFNVGAFLLAFITIFYIFYANSFLLALRRKELGMYMVLGAKKAKISQMLFGETLLMGIVSLVIGSLVGIALSSGIGQLLMSLLDISTEGYFPFYVPSLLMTWGFFLVLFLLTSTINAIRLARATELDLIRADQQNDQVKAKGIGTIVVAILGILLVTFGYYLLTHLRDYVAPGFIVGAVVTTIGTYLVFISLLPVFVQILKNNKKLNDRQLNAFTFAQLRFRVNNLTKILGTVAMLIALGVGAMAGGMAFQQNVELVASIGRGYDVTLQDPGHEDFQALATMQVLEQNEYRYKKDGKTIYYLKDDLLAHPPLISTNTMESYSPENSLKRASQPLTEKAYIMYRDEDDKQQPKELPEEWSQAISREFMSSYKMERSHDVQVVDPSIYNQVKGSEHKVVLVKLDEFVKYKEQLKAMDARQKELLKPEYMDKDADKDEEFSLETKYSVYEQAYAFTSGTLFMGFFLGVAFLAMMASCLMFKILSGATRDKDRYSMLRKIGVRKEMLVGSIYKELFIVFIFPAVIGLLHVLIGMEMFSIILLEPYKNIWIPTSIFVVIYALYYLITVRLYRGIVLPKEA